MNRLILAVIGCAAVLSVGASARAGNDKESSRDFPPGTFTDGEHYHLSDFKGKLVVLYFYSSECPRNRASIPDRDKVVEQFKGKPVVFLAISPGATVAQAQQFQASTRLEMPIYPDPLGVMQFRYGEQISLNNIWQFRVLDGDGRQVGLSMNAEAIQQNLAKVSWKYKDGGYDPLLNHAIDLLEWNQYPQGLAALRPFLTSHPKTVTESAKKLYDVIKQEADQWSADADKAVDDDPATAYDLYTRIVACFPKEDIGKNAATALKKLRTNKAVINELAARQDYAQLNIAMARATPAQKAQVIQFCTSIATKYPDAPTGQKAAKLAEELQKAPAPAE